MWCGHLGLLDPYDPVRRPNMSRMLFLDPHCQALYADWERKAGAVVGTLRVAVSRHPGAGGLSAPCPGPDSWPVASPVRMCAVREP
ncbi:MmyB family transcriptional regulator [Streptomyces uncialis]|uniref:MmyB family transcriptional regulator n=1 Tax=Streptomyces uncialis TaxID=1048205 RepID=UPI0033DA3EDC